MPMSIAQSRQQLSALIAAAQQQPQIITNRNTPVAVLVSADYFQRTQSATQPAQPIPPRFYDTLLRLRATFPPEDDVGIPAVERHTTWNRPNPFAESF